MRADTRQRALISGLTTSLLITLVLVPVVYTLFEEGLPALFKSTRAVAHGEA